MPRAKRYPGRKVHNKRYKNKIMHLVTSYVRYGLRLGVYSDGFDKFIRILKNRINRKLQNVIVIEGDTGSGKSTLGIEVGKALAEKLGVSFDLAKDMVYSLDDLWDKLDDPNASPISLLDEGSVSLNSLNSRRTGDRDAVVLLDTMRSRGWTTIIVLPSIKNLNASVRRVHVNYVLECSSIDNPFVKGFDRGFFEVKDRRESKKKRSDPDPWWNVLFTGIFGPLDEKTDKEYQTIKFNRQSKLIEEMKVRNTAGGKKLETTA